MLFFYAWFSRALDLPAEIFIPLQEGNISRLVAVRQLVHRCPEHDAPAQPQISEWQSSCPAYHSKTKEQQRGQISISETLGGSSVVHGGWGLHILSLPNLRNV